jgi:hypothetical protein
VKLKTARIATWLGLSVAAACLAAVATTGVSKVEFRQGPDQGSGTLVLRFDAAVPQFEAASEPWGVDVWLEGVSVVAVPFEGVRLVKEQGGTHVRFERAGTALEAVRVGANVVTLQLGLAAAILILKWRYGRDVPPPHYGAEQEEEEQ